MMIAILSPAKNMKPFIKEGLQTTKILFSEESKIILSVLKELSPWDLEGVMHLNPELAMRAYGDIQDLDLSKQGTPALLTYHGLQYKNISSYDFTKEDFCFADSHIRIISALYGMLLPSSEIQPYRLEMQCKIKINGKNLYQFWGEKLCQKLFENKDCILNLTSAEYAKAIIPYLKPQHHFLNCQFLVYRKGKFRALPTEAKMARGQMARYIVKNKVESPEQLKNFDWMGYSYSERSSDEKNFVFIK